MRADRRCDGAVALHPPGGITGSTGSDKYTGAGACPERGSDGGSSRSRGHAEIPGGHCQRHSRDRRCSADRSGYEEEIILLFYEPIRRRFHTPSASPGFDVAGRRPESLRLLFRARRGSLNPEDLNGGEADLRVF